MIKDLILIPNDIKKSQKIFLYEKVRLEKLLFNFSISVEHIGSTSIPQTIGKGIIDVLLLCPTPADQIVIRDILVKNQYKQGELDKIPDGRLFFSNTKKQTQVGDVHLHLVVAGSNNLESLAFRDYLLKHPEEVVKYNQEKTRLAAASNYIRHEYTLQKGAFISNLMSRIDQLKSKT